MQSIPQFNPTFTEKDIKSVTEYMNSGSFITEFKQSRHFEELLANYSNTKHAVLFPNGTLTIYAIIKCLKLKKKDKILVPNFTMAATAFVVPLGLFFPIQQFGSFYGQWGNLFTWFALGFALSQYQGWRNTKKNFYK